MSKDANDLLMSGGVPWASFQAIGDSVSGPLTGEPTTQQARDFDSGALKFWDDGEPIMEIVYVLATGQVDPLVDDDNGDRKVVLNSAHKKAAVRAAVKAAGAKGVHTGGVLTLTYSGQDDPKKKGSQGAKQFQATYVPPADALLNAPAALTPEQELAELKAKLAAPSEPPF